MKKVILPFILFFNLLTTSAWCAGDGINQNLSVNTTVQLQGIYTLGLSGYYDELEDGDECQLINATTQEVTRYIFDIDSAATEDLTGNTVITPDETASGNAYSGNARWIMLKYVCNGISAVSAGILGADPTLSLKDSDCLDAGDLVGEIKGAYVSGSAGSTQGAVIMRSMAAGTMTEIARFNSTGLVLGTGMGITIPQGATATAQVGYEASGNGTNTGTIQWPASIASNLTWTMPSSTGTIQITGVDLPLAGGAMTGGLTFSGSGEINLPSSDASPNTTGEIRHDSTVTGLTTGALAWYDGDEVRYLVDLDVLPSNDDYVVAYDADNDNFYMKQDASGAGDVTASGNNTFTGDNVFNNDVTIGDGGDDIRTTLNVNATDGTWSGVAIIRTVDSGAAASAFGQAYHVDSDGELICADADAATTAPCTALAITSGTGASKTVLLRGIITETDWNWTVGGEIYLGTDPATTCGLTQTAPSGTGDQVQVLGVALSADTIYFCPDLTLIEIQ